MWKERFKIICESRITMNKSSEYCLTLGTDRRITAILFSLKYQPQMTWMQLCLVLGHLGTEGVTQACKASKASLESSFWGLCVWSRGQLSSLVHSEIGLLFYQRTVAKFLYCQFPQILGKGAHPKLPGPLSHSRTGEFQA